MSTTPVHSNVNSQRNDIVSSRGKGAADMPDPLSSAKMELFDGLPTTVGGTNGITQISTLYQYNITLDQWFPHPKAKLKISRSSAAVFQVPRLHFRNC